MRLTGDVRELSMEEVEEKAVNNRDFNVAVYDIKKYPATRIFLIYRAKGECYDFDYAKEHRDHKLERERFSYGGMEVGPAGLTITDKCIECGNCFVNCPSGAIISKGV